jgi:hypothetical protein
MNGEKKGSKLEGGLTSTKSYWRRMISIAFIIPTLSIGNLFVIDEWHPVEHLGGENMT